MPDVIGDISITSSWRKKLFESKQGEKFLVNGETGYEIWHYTVIEMQKYNLQYYVSKIKVKDGYATFLFEAREFPTVRDISWNNSVNVL